MHNYSKLEQFLHRIALSTKYLREINFSIEKLIFLKSCETYSDNHVFITGLARSGTTILLNAIYESNQFASLTYEDMPFILSPNLWSKINGIGLHEDSSERFHGDGIKISTNSPEAFEEVFWKTFDSCDKESFEEFRSYIKLVLYKKEKNRYLSKNNQNIRRVKEIQQCFPKSNILIPYRDPLQHSFSLLTQHKKFIKEQNNNNFISNYMKWIGHSEFGLDYDPIINNKTTYNNYNELNHWLEQWHLLYDKLSILKNEKNVIFICYEDLCNKDQVWEKIQSIVEINQIKDFEFKESIKEIKLNYNKNLYDKCLSTYKNLKESF